MTTQNRAHDVTSSPQKMTTTEARLLEALTVSKTIKQAAERIGISVDHARHLVTQEPLKSRLAEMRQQAVEQALFEMSELSEVARQTLLAVLTDAKTPSYVKVQACRVVLDFEMALREGANADEQMAELQKLVEQAQQESDAGYVPAQYR